MQGAAALKPGEVGFGFVMDENRAITNSDLNRVIAVTPLLNATATGEFDSQPLDGKAVVLCLDTSTKMLAIRPDTHLVMVTGSKMLLESGIGTPWGTEIQPVIKPPRPPPQWVPVNRAGAGCSGAAQSSPSSRCGSS